MAHARRPTQLSKVSRSFGGRGFNDVFDDGTLRPGDPQNRIERASAFKLWREAFNHFEEYEDEDWQPLTFWQRYAEYLIAAAVIVFFVGSYTAFIVWLALTR